ncbi:hypothetical protein PVK06_011398 [Gossypium arboreum]|uniref:Uncharacterized protein n=1 Tax=Gossypium arboreum TaxID=29729 RepID=A0ABR0Q985_GOSAR|nr:hypothetical protein PVK06_011398 [Gossypium arboreum]
MLGGFHDENIFPTPNHELMLLSGGGAANEEEKEAEGEEEDDEAMEDDDFEPYHDDFQEAFVPARPSIASFII